ncbi:MAG: Ig-like domain-containing protein, partial [Acidobacteriota bacterium]
LEAGDVFTVVVNGVTYTAGDGNLVVSGTDWTLTVPAGSELPEGTYPVTATVTDAAGNAASDATTNELVIDTTPPAAPAVTALTTNDTTPAIHGTLGAALEAGDVFTVVVNGVTYTAGDGNLVVSGTDWTLTVPAGSELPEGTYPVTATVTDSAGNAASDATTNELVIDTTPPAAPAVTALTTNDTTPAIHGTLGAALEAGDVFTVTVNGVTYTAGDGNLVVSGTDWTLTVPAGSELPEGTYPVTATVTDSAGNAASDASTNELTIDTTPPVVAIAAPAEGSTTGDSTPTISGTTDAAEGSTVTVTIGAESHTATVQADGSWTLDWPTVLPDASYTVSASVTDPAGNTGSDSNGFTVLATPPSTPPIVTSPLYAGASVTVYGSSVEAPGSLVTVYVGGISAGTALVQADGSWSLAGVPLADGQSVTATVEAAGKLASGSSNTVVVAANSSDLTPAPILATPVAAGTTSVTGTSLPGATVDVYADGYYLGTTIADGTGAWTLSSLAPLPDGTLLSATATLAPGGTSSWSNTVVVGTAIHLLRSDDLTSLSQPIAPLFERCHPAFSSLAAMGPNHAANWGEGADATLPGTSDDDKAYVRGITSGTAEPDTTVLADNGRPLIFYELVDNGQKTLFLTKSGGNIVFTFTP